MPTRAEIERTLAEWGLCGEPVEDGAYLCIRDKGHPEGHGDSLGDLQARLWCQCWRNGRQRPCEACGDCRRCGKPVKGWVRDG